MQPCARGHPSHTRHQRLAGILPWQRLGLHLLCQLCRRLQRSRHLHMFRDGHLDAADGRCTPVTCPGLPPATSSNITWPGSCAGADFNSTCLGSCGPGTAGAPSATCTGRGVLGCCQRRLHGADLSGLPLAAQQRLLGQQLCGCRFRYCVSWPLLARYCGQCELDLYCRRLV